jgi:hypothetical protein
MYFFLWTKYVLLKNVLLLKPKGGLFSNKTAWKFLFLPSPLASRDLNCAKNKIVIIINRQIFFKIQSNEFFYYKSGLIHINLQLQGILPHKSTIKLSQVFILYPCFIFQEFAYLFGTFVRGTKFYFRDLIMFNIIEAMMLSVLGK